MRNAIRVLLCVAISPYLLLVGFIFYALDLIFDRRSCPPHYFLMWCITNKKKYAPPL